MKKCSKCQKKLSLDLFGKNKSEPDGYAYYCKPCKNLYNRQRFHDKYKPSYGHLRKQKGELLWCNGCEKFLPPNDFNRYAKAKSGRNSRCKLCVKKAYRSTSKPKEKLPQGMKRCTKCEEIKPFPEYHKYKNTHRARCKKCRYKGSVPYENRNIPRTQFTSYKCGARNRNILFKLTLLEFNSITSRPCTYCGSSKSPCTNGMGVDRVNNSKGYTLTNSVSCCTICNFMKKSLTEKEFKIHIKQICDYLEL